MKHKQLMISTSVIILGVLVGIEFYAYYSPPKERAIYQTTQHKDDTIRIAYIGDSWALGHTYHQCTIERIIEDTLHHPVTIASYGIGGLTSKDIYHALFEIEGFKQFMERGYDYCFISAGINDANKKMSNSYYKKSLAYIIRFMHFNHIYPIILEIPNVNLNKTYKNGKRIKKPVHWLSMIINGKQIDCKQDFRDALNEMIKEGRYENNLSVIRYKTWNENYEKDLKTMYIDDQVHLNERGYQVLDSVIAKEIYEHYRQKNYDNE